ncbi:hypothetical protein GDO81_030163 [Engystomops pustulosus]|uniref:Uncharacterized protein n=1 Tax=Engystomops pustulosus TaxID=76066 RepID=A0AAV6ZAW0_ENGPU|nr:hypothetical protein GDO81_030163 [Engystomops pustulosus]
MADHCILYQRPALMASSSPIQNPASHMQQNQEHLSDGADISLQKDCGHNPKSNTAELDNQDSAVPVTDSADNSVSAEMSVVIAANICDITDPCVDTSVQGRTYRGCRGCGRTRAQEV